MTLRLTFANTFPFAAATAVSVWLLLAPAAQAGTTPAEIAFEQATEAAVDAAMRSVRIAAGDGARIEIEQDVRADGGGGLAGGAGSERVVKGAPYCAEAVHENVQWLPDPTGAAPNRIVRQNTTRLCRDGEGRTRQEVERGGRRIVYLRDPVAREGWVIDPERRTARRLASAGALPLDAMADAAHWRDYAEQMREWARGMAEAARAQARAGHGGAAAVAPTPPAPPPPPVPPVAAVAPVAPVAPVPPAPVVISRRDADVTVMRLDRDGPRWDLPAPPPAVQWRASSLAPRGPGVTTALPARDFEGVRAHGERTTWVIEAGRVGNERPIQIVREVWTAPELLLTVSSRDFDPRSGEVNYRLKNLKRGEPEADLMRVPADYTRQDRGGRGGSSPGASSAPRG